MANLLSRLRGERSIPISSIDDYIQAVSGYAGGFTFGNLYYPNGIQQTLTQATERPFENFTQLAQQAYAANGVVFACMLVRQLTFSSIRFRWQRMLDGSPSDGFGTPALGVLERPWVGGTTQDLLSRTIQDVDLAGNAYWTRQGDELIRMRPDWVEIVVQKRTLTREIQRDGQFVNVRGQLGWKKLGYLYTEGGINSGEDPVPLLANEVAHYAPLPDPLSPFRGMSWLTPIMREIQADKAMSRHKLSFFVHGATPNMIIKHPTGATEDKVRRWDEMFREQHVGPENAYKNLNLYPGADAAVVGKDFRQVDFKSVMAAGETRIAAAAGVPPVIVGLSEGLAAATYSNYGQARRRLADGTAHPLWQNAAGSFEPVVMMPPGNNVRLWYDATDVPFLREDEKDAADIQSVRARTISTYIQSGYTPESAVRAVTANDERLLEHTGLYSVQLQAPGTGSVPAIEASPTPPSEGDGDDDDGD